ncbi:MAG: FecR family protein [Spirochaetia bacterium]|nr:FecR family protein [Spirochaetia bacterium]
MNMNKKKILDSFLNLINGEENINKKQNDASETSEERFIKSIYLENTDNSQMPVPEKYMDLILKKAANQKIAKNSFNLKKSFTQIFSLHPISVYAVSAISFILLISTFELYRINFRDNVIQISSINSNSKNETTLIDKGSILYEKGIEIKALEKGEIGQELNSSHRNILSHLTPKNPDNLKNNQQIRNIFFKKGKWQVNTHHEQLEMQTWFHFPGGGIRPIGTAFNINIEKQQTTVELTEGKIESYTLNKDGILMGITIESAPFKGVYNSEEIIKNIKNKIILNEKEKKLEEEKTVKNEIQNQYQNKNSISNFDDNINSDDTFSEDFMEKEPEEDTDNSEE